MNYSSEPRVTGLFLVLAAIFVTLLVTSNIIAVKLIEVYGRILPAAIVLFPMTYILGDIFTEVYGFRYARRVIWLGFMCNAVAVVGFWIGRRAARRRSFWEGPGLLRRDSGVHAPAAAWPPSRATWWASSQTPSSSRA